METIASLGGAALDNEEYDTAIACFREVLRQMPFRNDVRQLLAYALDQQVQADKKLSAPSPQKREREHYKVATEKVEPSAERPSKKRLIPCSCWLTLFAFLCLAGVVVFIIMKEPILDWLKSNLPEQIPLVTPEEKKAIALYAQSL